MTAEMIGGLVGAFVIIVLCFWSAHYWRGRCEEAETARDIYRERCKLDGVIDKTVPAPINIRRVPTSAERWNERRWQLAQEVLPRMLSNYSQLGIHGGNPGKLAAGVVNGMIEKLITADEELAKKERYEYDKVQRRHTDDGGGVEEEDKEPAGGPAGISCN